MKTIILLFLIISTTACTMQNNAQINNIGENKSTVKLEKIELKEQTRGTNRIITFNSKTLMTSLNGNLTQSKIALPEWENVEKQINLVDLSKISSFAAPSTGHYSDQALASTIIITSNGNTYQSSSFDFGNPPKELESLYKALRQIIQSKKTTY